MTKHDIIRMAREAGLLVIGTADGGEAVYTWPQGITEELERFFRAAYAAGASAEREACAKIVDDSQDGITFIGDRHVTVATAIRSRGKE